MNKQLLKFMIASVLVFILSITDCMFLLSGLISYSADNNGTNQSNVKFSSYFKDENGNTITSKDVKYNQTDEYIYLQLEVQKEGYFQGTVTLSDSSNFKLVSSDSEYVESINDNTIQLHTITAGATIEIAVKIEPIYEESFSIGLLSVESEIVLNGTYYDSTEKDKTVKSTKTVTLNYLDEITQENIVNNISVITNQIIEIDGEEKRVIQLSWDIGLQENSYPIKNIDANISVPTIEEETPEINTYITTNTMTNYEINYNSDNAEIILNNDASDSGEITWETEGTENIVLTYIYDKDTVVEGITLEAETNITLYDNKEITAKTNITIGQEEQDNIIQISITNNEDEIYKGKLIAGVEKTYVSRTNITVNLANAVDSIDIYEQASNYVIEEESEEANIYFSSTRIKKEQFDEILGENGSITITDDNGEVLSIITSDTEVNSTGYFVVTYSSETVKNIHITTTSPIAEGTLGINHVKVAKETQVDIVKQATQIQNTINYQYNQGSMQQVENLIELKDSTTKSKFTIDKTSLSTVVENSVEMKITLLTNDEQYDLYENPEFVIQLPEQIENIEILNINTLYDENQDFSTPTYTVDGRTIHISLEGKQSTYTSSSLEGITIVINANITVYKTSATSSEQIQMAYKNDNAVNYENDESVGYTSTDIEIKAPKEMTLVNSISELDIETVGETEQETVVLDKGAEEKTLQTQMEIINSNTSNLSQMTILGEFPTDNTQNNMGIEITSEVTLSGVEEATIYYTENENATADLDNEENGWSTEIVDGSNVKKYLIIANEVSAQSSIYATYNFTIPEDLEYNLNSSQGYSITAINTDTGFETSMSSTTILLDTGVGPELDITLNAIVGTDTLGENGTVKTGEVIKYEIEVTNNGTETAENVTVTGQVPDGTTLVEPMNNFEYTGAAYYQEAEGTIYEETISSLAVGETKTIEYEVRVNSDTTAGTILTNYTTAECGDVSAENEITSIVETANIRVSIKRVSDMDQVFYEDSQVNYYVIVENISNEVQDNVVVNNYFSDNVDITRVQLITGMGIWEENFGGDTSADYDDDIEYPDEDDVIIREPDNPTSVDVEYAEQINIGSLDVDDIIVLRYTGVINDGTSDSLTFYATATDSSNIQTRANAWEDTVEQYELELSMTTDTESQYVKAGDTIGYTIEVKNVGRSDCTGVFLYDTIPSALTIESVTLDGKELDYEFRNNQLTIEVTPSAGESTYIEVKTTVEDSLARTEPEIITNVATTEVYEEEISSNEITHIIEPTTLTGYDTTEGEDTYIEVEVEGTDPSDEYDDDNVTIGEGGTSSSGSSSGSSSNIANGSYMISGTAWLDEDQDGQKDTGETLLSGITIKLLNAETNQLVKNSSGEVLETTTNSSGLYILQNIVEGKYIVIFEYDESQYQLTQYKASGVQDSQSSSAIMNDLTINGVTTSKASTDIITVEEESISNINIGLIALENFDLQLNKYVSKITVQNGTSSTVMEYENTNLAKVELNRKTINGSTVTIEYSIVITNVGEVDGYVKEIVDYMPSDLEFSQTLNSDWYLQNGKLYNTSLENEKISAGESKTITLTLTKTMTSSDTGRVINTAEIGEDYNELGISDSNSTPGNRASDENDIDSAEVIISVSTGGIVYASIIIVIIIVAIGIAVIIYRKRKALQK